jgi:hypothetical protein
MFESDESLRESIRRIGLLLPVYRWDGDTIDGARRHRAAIEVAIVPTIVECRDESHAAQVLWRLHPDRAWARWHPATPLAAVALFGARLSDVAPYFRRLTLRKVYPARVRHGRRCRSQLAGDNRINLRLSSDALKTLTELATSIHVTPSEYARVALVLSNPEQVKAYFLARSTK